MIGGRGGSLRGGLREERNRRGEKLEIGGGGGERTRRHVKVGRRQLVGVRQKTYKADGVGDKRIIGGLTVVLVITSHI